MKTSKKKKKKKHKKKKSPKKEDSTLERIEDFDVVKTKEVVHEEENYETGLIKFHS
jgi:hypothetical protein